MLFYALVDTSACVLSRALSGNSKTVTMYLVPHFLEDAGGNIGASFRGDGEVVTSSMESAPPPPPKKKEVAGQKIVP